MKIELRKRDLEKMASMLADDAVLVFDTENGAQIQDLLQFFMRASASPIVARSPIFTKGPAVTQEKKTYARPLGYVPNPREEFHVDVEQSEETEEDNFFKDFD